VKKVFELPYTNQSHYRYEPAADEYKKHQDSKFYYFTLSGPGGGVKAHCIREKTLVNALKSGVEKKIFLHPLRVLPPCFFRAGGTMARVTRSTQLKDKLYTSFLDANEELFSTVLSSLKIMQEDQQKLGELLRSTVPKKKEFC